MNIRTKLTLRFILITAVILLLASFSIYVFSANYREEEFYNRLENKANNTAKLLIEVDEVDVNLLRRLEEDNPVSLPQEKITIYNFRDSILFTTDESQTIRISEELLTQIRLEGQVRHTQGDYEVLGFLFKAKYDRFVVVAAAVDVYGWKKINNLRFILLVVFASSIVMVSFTGWLYAGRALQPIAKVVNQVSDISINSLNLRVDEGNGKDEIAKLAQTFNSMLKRLQSSFITQKNFIANASHELRTPLTAITGQIEVTLLNTRSAKDYQDVLNSILEDIKNLNLLSNRLLLLAQTSSEERQKKMSHLRIDELIWQAKEELTRLNNHFVINIDLNENLDDESKLTIHGDEQLIKIALSNVMENGCKYSADHTVNVFIQSATPREIEILFRDRGIGIPGGDLKNIFQPFYRGSNTQGIKGHGIGLSMVRGIVKLHNGNIEIRSHEQEGTSVKLSFLTAESFV
jgi:signal transduction histidine kinase